MTEKNKVEIAVDIISRTFFQLELTNDEAELAAWVFIQEFYQQLYIGSGLRKEEFLSQVKRREDILLMLLEKHLDKDTKLN